jgi:hypothetical protein
MVARIKTKTLVVLKYLEIAKVTQEQVAKQNKIDPGNFSKMTHNILEP